MSRNYEILNMNQRSDEWFKIRSNCITGTSAKHLLKKGKEATLEIVKRSAEKALQHPVTGWAAKRGQDLEPRAREMLNRKLATLPEFKDVTIEEVGFVKRTDIEHVGCSPDGVFMVDGEIKYNCEIKCFMEEHHLECSGFPDHDINVQIQWCLFVTGAEFCFFVQFNPDMLDKDKTSDGKEHPDKVLFITKIYPDPEYFAAFERKLT